ncbi:MAG: hypothetical protein WBM95_05175, partial [Robiginitalea sp.]
SYAAIRSLKGQETEGLDPDRLNRIDQMIEEAIAVVNPGGIAFGGEGSPGTFEWGGYFNTQYFADPGEQVIGILMKQTQGNAGDQTGWKFKQMVFAAIAD